MIVSTFIQEESRSQQQRKVCFKSKRPPVSRREYDSAECDPVFKIVSLALVVVSTTWLPLLGSIVESTPGRGGADQIQW